MSPQHSGLVSRVLALVSLISRASSHDSHLTSLISRVSSHESHLASLISRVSFHESHLTSLISRISSRKAHLASPHHSGLVSRVYYGIDCILPPPVVLKTNGVNVVCSSSNTRLAYWRFLSVSCCLNIWSGSKSL